MDKNKIEENYKIEIVDSLKTENKISEMISDVDKKVLEEGFKNYYKSIYTQSDFNMLSKEELYNVNVAFTNAYNICKNNLAKEDFNPYYLNKLQENYYYLKLNYMLARWTFENYDEMIYENFKNIKKYDSEFLDILKHHIEFDEDRAVKHQSYDGDTYYLRGIYDWNKDYGFYTVKSDGKLIDDIYYEIEVNTPIRVKFENSMLNELKVGDKIRVYRYKKGIKDNIYYDFIFKGFVQYDDVFWKHDKDSEELKQDEDANEGYEYYKKFFNDINVTKFAKFEWENMGQDDIEEDVGSVDVKDNFQYVAINENRFSAPLFNLYHIGAQLYESPFRQYELFYNINFSSDFKIRVMKNALLLDSGGSIGASMSCFMGDELNEKLELKDENNAMYDIGKKNLNELFSYMYFSDYNYITCLVDIAHSESDTPDSFGQFNKPLFVDIVVKKGTRVYKEPDDNSEVIYTFEEDAATDSKKEDDKYDLQAFNVYIGKDSDKWVKVRFTKWVDRSGWRTYVQNGWIKSEKFEIKERKEEEYWTWYPYS